MPSRPPLPEDFAATWTRSPIALVGDAQDPFVSDAETLAFLKTCARRHRQGLRSPEVRIFIDFALGYADYLRYLPNADDRTLDSYLARIDKVAEGRPVAIVVNDAQSLDRSWFERCCAFTAELQARTGCGVLLADMVLFLGNSDRTPFGIHQDEKEVFQFVTRGRKRMRLWPEGFENDRGEAIESVDSKTEYAAFLDGSAVIEAGPGDVLYWPMSSWHVAESLAPGTTHAGWSLGYVRAPELTLDGLAFEAVAGFLSEAVNSRATNPLPAPLPRTPRSKPGSASASDAPCPETLRAFGAGLAKTVTSLLDDPGLQDHLVKRWLQLRSAYGFQLVPDPRPASVGLDRVVRAHPLFPALTGRLADGRLAIAVAGTVTEADDAPWVSALLGRVAATRDAAEPVTAGELIRHARGEGAADADAVRQVLIDMNAAGGLR